MKRISLICFVCVFALVFQVSLAGAADKKPVKIVGSMAMSGIAGAIPEQAWGVIDAADYINKTGGIGGRPFVAIMEDGRYDVPATLGIYNRYMTTEPEDEYLFYCQYNTPGLKALQEKVNKEDKIPVLAGSGSAIIFDENVQKNSPYFFSTLAGYGEMWAAVLKYIKLNHKKKTPPRCAFHYYDNSTGRDPMDYLDRYAKKFGVDIVMKEPFSPTAQTFAPAFLKFRQNKIEYVLFWNWSLKISAKYYAEFRKYLPNLTSYGVHWTVNNIGFHVAKEAFDGHYGVTPFPGETEMDNKFVQIVTKAAKEKNRNVRAWQFYMQSWTMGLIAGGAARQVLAEGKPLTRENCRDAIENIKNFDMLGIFGGQYLDYRNHKYSPLRMLRADWSKKTQVPVTPWLNVYDYIK
jgi:ABC-type branched-subunit amino acid transport system substrate-binding protein